MDPLLVLLAVAAIGLAVGNIIVSVRRRRARARALAEVMTLANDALEQMVARSVRAVPVDSPEGQAILAKIRMGCPCPNCEEERRIAHAAQQQGGES